jgi:hypothetical protein
MNTIILINFNQCKEDFYETSDPRGRSHWDRQPKLTFKLHLILLQSAGALLIVCEVNSY